MRIGRLSCLIAVLALGLQAGACGGGDDDESGSSATTRKAYFDRANRICKQFNAKADANEKKLFARYKPKAAPPEVYSRYAKRTAPVLRRGFTRLRQVPPPKGEKRQVEQILDESDRAIRQMERAAEDPQEARPFYRSGGPFARQNELADQYGLVECAHQYNPRFDE